MSNTSDSTTSHSTEQRVSHETSTEKVVWPWRTLILVAIITALVVGALCALYHYLDEDDGHPTIVHVQQTDDCENVTASRLTGECPPETPVAVDHAVTPVKGRTYLCIDQGAINAQAPPPPVKCDL